MNKQRPNFQDIFEAISKRSQTAPRVVSFADQKKKKTKVKLNKHSDNNSSLLFATTIKLKNNPINIADITTTDGEKLSLLIEGDMRIKNKKTKEFVIDTTKVRVDSSLTIQQIEEYLNSPDYKIKSLPELQLNTHDPEQKSVIFDIYTLLDTRYSEKEIREFVDHQLKLRTNSKERYTVNS